MDGITNQKEYVEKNARIVEEKIASVEKLLQAGEDKMIVRAAFKELKRFVRTEYDTFHKKKYFGTYIFDCYHPLVEGIHLSAWEKRVSTPQWKTLRRQFRRPVRYWKAGARTPMINSKKALLLLISRALFYSDRRSIPRTISSSSRSSWPVRSR